MQEPTKDKARPARMDLLLIQTGARIRERFARAYDWLAGLRRVERRRLLRRLRMSLAMLALFIATSGMPIPAHAASMTVVSGAAGLLTDGKCSLAEAIVNANNDAATWPDCVAGSGTDTITLPSGATLSYSNALGSSTALPLITSDITIIGNGSTIRRAGAGTNFRIITVNSGASLELRNATISGGNIGGSGGGISNEGTLTVRQSTISGNTAGNGGGISNSGTLTVNQSTVSGNHASYGGGIYSSTAMTISASTLSNNAADISSYTGGGGLAIVGSNTVTLSNITISGNSTTRKGAGIIMQGSATVNIYNSTITGNTASGGSTYGGGIYQNNGMINLVRTIVSGNTADQGRELYVSLGILNASNFNLFGHSGEASGDAFISFTPGASDINATSDGTPAALASILNTTLANNGGPTFTHNLVTNSPALDKATGNSCQAAPVNGLDQRYKVRAAGAGLTCDIGAVEFNAPTAVTLSSFEAKPGFDLGAWLKKFLGR